MSLENSMPPYVIYSHTDYLPILKIQTDYNKSLGNRTLLINKEVDICKEYERVIYYDESLPYASRLLNCFKQIKDDYFVLLHEFDILLNVDKKILLDLIAIMAWKDIDRIDLKHTFNTEYHSIIDTSRWTDIPLNLVKADNPQDYIYNVNPSIWKRESYIEILEKYKYANYREIECWVQDFCTKFNIYKMNAPNWIEVGWFFCLPFFTYLHVTHGGKILPLNPPFYMTPSRQSYASVAKEYTEMYKKYDMGNIKLEHYLG